MYKAFIGLLLCICFTVFIPLNMHVCDSSEHFNNSINAISDQETSASLVLAGDNHYTLDEFLMLLNAGYILPSGNVRRFITNAVGEMLELEYGAKCCDYYNDCDHIAITPYYSPWPWTDSSNFFGHSWGAWESWHQTGPTRHGSGCGVSFNACNINITRGRSCTRTQCTSRQTELDTATVSCPIR